MASFQRNAVEHDIVNGNSNNTLLWYNTVMTYSLDLQQKVLQYIDKTGNISKASNVAQMSRNTLSVAKVTKENR